MCEENKGVALKCPQRLGKDTEGACSGGYRQRRASLSRISVRLLFVPDFSWGGVRPTSSR